MRLTARLCLFAFVTLLLPRGASAQAELQTYFNWCEGFSTYASYGGGCHDHRDYTGGPNSYSWITFPPGGTYAQAGGTGESKFGVLTASSYAYANGVNGYYSSALFITESYFRDVLTIVSDGQLSFSMFMGETLNVHTGLDNPTCGASYSPYFVDQCARAASKLNVTGSVYTNLALGHTTLSAPTPNSAHSGPLNVHAGDVIQVDGFLMVGLTTCESENPYPCSPITGNGSAADGSGWANFFIDESGGASYTSASGTQYLTSVPVVATPEPTTFVLLASGMISVGFIRRKKGRACSPEL